MSRLAASIFQTCHGNVRSKPSISIDLDGDHDRGYYPVPFTTGQKINGTIFIAGALPASIEEVEIVLEGRSQTTVHQSTPRGRSGLQHAFLYTCQKIDGAKLRAHQGPQQQSSYQVPLTLEIPDRCSPGACRELSYSHSHLPPTLNDPLLAASKGFEADTTMPSTGQVTYRVQVVLSGRSSPETTTINVLATATKPIWVLPTTQNALKLCSSLNTVQYERLEDGKMQSILFEQKRTPHGNLEIHASPPESIQLPSPGQRESYQDTLTSVDVKIFFKPRKFSDLPPQICTLQTKLVSCTSLKASPTKFGASWSFCSDEDYRRVHTHSMSLSNMKIGHRQWNNQDTDIDSSHSFESLLKPIQVEDTDGTGAGFVMNFKVPIRIPRENCFAATFESCLISRYYFLDLTASYLFRGTLCARQISLRVPISFCR